MTLPNKKLSSLGWDQFFQNQIEDISNKQHPARVVSISKIYYQVNLAGEEVLVTLAGKFFHNSDLPVPVVGDWVLVEESAIVGVLQRKNALSRMAPTRRGRKESEVGTVEQIMAANLDMVFIVCGLDRDYNLRRIERYLTMIYNCGISPAVILTKADLHEEPESFKKEVEEVAFGVPVYLVSADDPEVPSGVQDHLTEGKTVSLIGSSGAGKSTLINRLVGKDIRATGTVSDNLGKGKHTTTSRDLIVLPSGAIVIDNPGIREVALAADDSKAESAFPDIEELVELCRFADCSHNHEPGCRVQEAVASGEISADRFTSYQKIKSELDFHVQRERKSAARVERERWKGVAKKIKSINKKKGRR